MTGLLADNHAAAYLAAVASSAEEAIIGLDPDGTVAHWNDAATRLLGFHPDEIIGQNVLRLVPPALKDTYLHWCQQVRDGQRLLHVETELLNAEEQPVSVIVTMAPVRDGNGQVIGTVSIARHASWGAGTGSLARQLRRQEGLLQSVLDTVPHGLIVIDAKGAVQFFSPAAERMFGFASDEVIGQNVRMLMPEPYAEAHDGYLERYLSTGEKRIIGIGRILVGQRKGGTPFPLELQVGEVAVAGVRLFTGFTRDLTEPQARDRRMAELQSELLRVARLSELGQMVSVLAHEVNQPLTAVSNYIGGLKRMASAPGQERLLQAIGKMAEQTERARMIIRNLRDFLRKDSRSWSVVNMETMVQETSALALAGTGRSVDLALSFGPLASRIFGDKVQIQQLLLNLMRNAVEAMEAQPPPHCLSIETRRIDDRVGVTIADNGPGLPENVRMKLFQPFVTTKPDGLGIGLSICRTIAEAHGGDLTAQPVPGGGVAFHFTVPAASDSRDA